MDSSSFGPSVILQAIFFTCFDEIESYLKKIRDFDLYKQYGAGFVESFESILKENFYKNKISTYHLSNICKIQENPKDQVTNNEILAKVLFQFLPTIPDQSLLLFKHLNNIEIVEILSVRDEKGNTLLHNEEVFHHLIGFLLTKITPIEFYSLTKISNFNNKFPLEVLEFDRLTQVQLLRLCTIEGESHRPVFNNSSQNLFIRLPSFAQEYRLICQKRDPKIVVNEIRKLSTLTIDGKNAAIAFYINKCQLPLHVFADFTRDEFLDIAEYLCYLNFTDFDPIWAKDITLRCKYPFILITNSGEFLNSFEELSLCKFLDVSNCEIQKIPRLPICNELYVTYCLNLTSIPGLPLCRYLKITLCPKIEKFPSMPSLKILKCDFCPSVKYLPQVPDCIELSCIGCQGIKSIETYPLCTRITCSHCVNLERIDTQPSCEELDCNTSLKLAYIGDIPKIRFLNCDECSLITSLPPLQKCKILRCRQCSLIEELPSLKECEFLDCQYCTNLKALPELPYYALVYANGAGKAFGISRLIIDKNQLYAEPQTVLLYLSKFLLKGKHLPDITYTGSGNTIDLGGVRRDLVAMLLSILFLDPTCGIEELKGFLKRDVSGLPMLQNKSEDEVNAYRTIARLMAIAYKGRFLKLGSLFPDIVYKCMTTSGIFDQDLSRWRFKLSLLLKDAPLPLFDFCQKYLITPDQRDRIVMFLQVYVPELVDESIDPIEFFSIHRNREVFYQAVVEDAQSNKSILAIEIMTKEIAFLFGQEKWKEVCQQGHQAFQTKIQGTLDREILSSKLRFFIYDEDIVPKNLAHKSKQYIYEWIKKADIKLLQLFVRSVTGQNALAHENINVFLRNINKEYLPSTHTCNFQLDLPVTYPNLTHFAKKLELLLLEGMSFEIT